MAKTKKATKNGTAAETDAAAKTTSGKTATTTNGGGTRVPKGKTKAEDPEAAPKTGAAPETGTKTAKRRTKAQDADVVEKPTKAVQKLSEEELAALRASVGEAETKLEAAKAEAAALEEKARTLLSDGKRTYLEALAPYRDACRRARIACEFRGGRGENVSERVSFLVERTGKGVKVEVKGRPDTADVIPLPALEESANKVALLYTEKHLGPRETVGNKAGSLSNRLRAVMKS